MAIPAGVNRISLIGTQPHGEQFDTSFWLASQNVTSAAEANALAANVAGHLESEGLNLKAMLMNGAAYTSVRAYCYPQGGPAAQYVGTADVTGMTGTSSVSLPLQTCAVASLHTGLSGRSYRGRMYLPLTGAALQNGYIKSDALDEYGAAIHAFLQAENDDESAQSGIVVIVSQTRTLYTPVTAVTMDDKPDVQRRRAASAAAGNTYSGDITH